ncbi:RNB domain-containing ribonuclease [Agreia sp. COWG]|uniref:RNB domain-containing ribonuclease n=1 Tax=Agreia sp. COWG TaxID=2773266 RepID=UPI001925D7EA|nr:RNB domain-containing ribonuclease [Agreia sp. COWG]CAD5991383.1 Exoribonuclease R [Agreia sp. COWG]
MTRSPLRLSDTDGDALASAIAAIRHDLALPVSFSPEVEAEAARAIAEVAEPELDLTAIAFVTIDPEGATDLDQAVHIERRAEGYLLSYAIADVPAFVIARGAVDTEARRRGQTLYAPDGRIPLHPTVISEHAASLLPGVVRSAFVWQFELGPDATVASTRLSRARIRSVRQLSYVDAQREIDEGEACETLRLLRPLGEARIELERARGGASLSRPEQVVELRDGRYTLDRRTSLPVENWNAQVSLLTGIAAAEVMLAGRIGILRTMPLPRPETIERFRRQTEALGHVWPVAMPYGQFLKTLDPANPLHAAITHAAGSLFRGAGYTAFDGEVPAQPIQAAVGAPYAHTTAPLRRLVDRFTLIVCEALLSGSVPPQWVREALPTLPGIMSASDSLASRLDNRSIAAVEAALLSARVSEVFDASVISAKESRGTIQLTDPAVDAECTGALVPGARVRVRLVEADIATGTVRFELVTPPDAPGSAA